MRKSNFIIFGANGDLALKKLFPALYNLFLNGHLAEEFKIIGISRTSYSDEEFAKNLQDYFITNSSNYDEAVWLKFAPKISYFPMDVNDISAYIKLREKLDSFNVNSETADNFFYLATSPNLYEQILIKLTENGFISDNNQGYRTDLIVEKPIGKDLASAKNLNRVFSKYLNEQQIYRIDHYLGKETVQNILLFRFTNAIFESIWNHKYIDQIEITVAESVDVSGRAGYYDQSGCLRDMIQNHLFQLLSLICIEPPATLGDSRSIRDEKVKVLRSLRRFDEQSIRDNVIRGQYLAGEVNGKAIEAYLQHSGVKTESKTETYVALKLEIDNWRWHGVPVLLRSGKCLTKRHSEINVYFKKTPPAIFKNLKNFQIAPNILSFQIQPDEGISIQFNSKPPGLDMQMRPVEMDFEYDESFSEVIFDAYERLILDILRGDQTLFIRDDEVEESWDVLDPILKAWENDNTIPLYSYQPGSEGPEEAGRLVENLMNTWKKI